MSTLSMNKEHWAPGAKWGGRAKLERTSCIRKWELLKTHFTIVLVLEMLAWSWSWRCYGTRVLTWNDTFWVLKQEQELGIQSTGNCAISRPTRRWRTITNSTVWPLCSWGSPKLMWFFWWVGSSPLHFMWFSAASSSSPLPSPPSSLLFQTLSYPPP